MTKLECCIPKAGTLVPELCLLLRVLSLIMTFPCFVCCHSQNALSYTVKKSPLHLQKAVLQHVAQHTSREAYDLESVPIILDLVSTVTDLEG